MRDAAPPTNLAPTPEKGNDLRKRSSDTPPERRPLFRREVVEFQQHNRQWGRVVPLQPLSTKLLIWSVFAASAAVIAFLFVAQYARKEIAPGYLTPVAGTARVFAAQPGIISAVYVQQGAVVEKGQPLLAVLTSQIAANGDDVNATILATLEQRKSALMRKIADEVHRTEFERQRLTAQIAEHEKILEQLASQATVQRARIAIQSSIVEVGASLRAKGLVSEVDQRHRQEMLLEQQQGLITLQQQATTRRGDLAGARTNLEQLPFSQGDKMQALQGELASTEQRIAEINGRSAYIVRAPVSGRVSLLQSSAGQPADPKRMQLEIVPSDGQLQAELFVPVRAIGFVEVGQDVRILFDAFPYQRFGTYHGRITKLSQTVVLPSDVDAPIALREPAYMATVALDQPHVTANGKRIALRPDMSLRADIILEKRTLVDWIVAPLRHLRIEG